MLRLQSRSARGVTLVEVAIGTAIAALVIVFAAQTIGVFINSGRDVASKTKAIYFIEDGFELLRYVRDGSWATIQGLNQNTTYYLNVTSSGVYVVTTPQVTDGYTRSFRVANAYRNAADDLFAQGAPGATLDTSTKFVTMSVSYGSPTSSIAITSLITEIDP